MTTLTKEWVTVPTSSNLIPLTKSTWLSLRSVVSTKNDILKHIRKLNSNKAHGHDMISIRIIKLFDDSIVHPLYLIYKSCARNNHYPNKWKMANVIPVLEKKRKIR